MADWTAQTNRGPFDQKAKGTGVLIFKSRADDARWEFLTLVFWRFSHAGPSETGGRTTVSRL